jgi:formylglycine-generating enzyme
MMIRLVLLGIFMTMLATGCGIIEKKEGKNGELTGVKKRPIWDNPNPYGMVKIPAGSYHMGNNEQDVSYSQIAHNRQVTVSAFYMDETEIENNEYRQYYKNVKAQSDVAYIQSTIEFLQGYYGLQNLTVNEDLEKLITPDTLVWMRDMTFSYNEPLTENYWWHPAFDNYPVVGVNWFGAQAFCYWRSKLFNNFRTENKKVTVPRFRLPTEAEWEYAARGGFEHRIYPWEGPYIKNSRGCLFANFKPGRGDYIADNFEYTCPVKSYWPNDYGLYCMAGNVSEWCEDDYEETGYTYDHDLNPIYRDPLRKNNRRMVRGGSWKSIGYFLSVGTRDYEYSDTTKSHIGFRTVVTELGRKNTDNL